MAVCRRAQSILLQASKTISKYFVSQTQVQAVTDQFSREKENEEPQTKCLNASYSRLL